MDKGVTHRRAVYVLYACHDETHLARLQNVALLTLGGENPNSIHLMSLTNGFGDDLVALAQLAMLYPHQRNHAQIIVEPGVNNECLQGCVPVALWRWNTLHQTFQCIFNTQPGFGTHKAGVSGIDTDNFLDLDLYLVRVRLRQVHFIEDWQHLQALLYRGVTVGD